MPVQYGADPEAADRLGQTALMVAVFSGQLDGAGHSLNLSTAFADMFPGFFNFLSTVLQHATLKVPKPGFTTIPELAACACRPSPGC